MANPENKIEKPIKKIHDPYPNQEVHGKFVDHKISILQGFYLIYLYKDF